MLSHLTKIQAIDAKQITKLSEVLSDLSKEQKLWLSGYLAGQSIESSSLNQEINQKTSANPEAKLTVLYGSQTGNSRMLAENFFSEAQSQGFQVSLVSLADFKPRQITKENNVALIVSTHGEGEAPDDAEIFYEYLFSNKAPKLSQLNFSVLALGDSSYEQYCQTGVDLDLQLEKLGAKRVVDRVDCDLDFEQSAESWQQQTLEYFAKELGSVSDTNVVPLSLIKNNESVIYNRNHPYSAEIISLQKITTQDSVKNIYHIELSLEDSNIEYLPGDSIGILTFNQSQDVANLLSQLKIDRNDLVAYKGKELCIEYLLTEILEISLLNRNFLKYYSTLAESSELFSIVDKQDSFNKFVKNRQLIDVLKEYPTPIGAQDLVDHLIKITPRLYSISSSHKANPEEVHLTIALVELDAGNRTGLASGALCRFAEEGDFVKVYIEANNNFKIPSDAETPTIMVGPGTGVAPFRAFLQERQELGHQGQNWLFFGNPSFENDFLYQLEWQDFIKSGVLNKIDLAFSRDQQQKIYVQHRLQENSEQVWEWLEKGAHFYICGDKDRMAKDVESTLLTIIQEQGNQTQQQAVEYLKQMKRSKRYQKDVY
jgi:sulfite reductase (NADPH) flavoprotein alpha-component